MNLLKDEKFKDLLNYDYTFDEKVVELASILSEFEGGGDLPDKVETAFGFLVAMREYLAARREINARKIALDQLSQMSESRGREGDDRLRAHLSSCEQGYYRASDRFVEKNYDLKQNIDRILDVLNSARCDGASAPEPDALWTAFDARRPAWGDRYPVFVSEDGQAPAGSAVEQAAQAEAELRLLLDEKAASDARLEALTAETAALKEQISTAENLRREHAELRDFKADADVAAATLEAEKAALEAEKAALLERVETLEAAAAERAGEWAGEVSSTRARLDQALAELEDLQQQRDELARERERQDGELDELRGDKVLLDSYRERSEELERRVTSLEAQLASASAGPAPTEVREERAQSEAERQALSGELDRMRAQRDVLEAPPPPRRAAALAEHPAPAARPVARDGENAKVRTGDLSAELDLLSRLQRNLEKGRPRAAGKPTPAAARGGNKTPKKARAAVAPSRTRAAPPPAAPAKKRVARKKPARKAGAKSRGS